VSPALAELNFSRYADWDAQGGKAAVLAFAGDVYEGLDAPSLSPEALTWAQSHLGILSGLYGLLRPLDEIQPYRLEMGIRLPNARGRDLYAFWGTTLCEAIHEATLAASGTPCLINLASEEYFKAARAKDLDLPILTPVFEDAKNGQFKVISFRAKRARGLMARFIIENRLESPADLQKFSAGGYTFTPEASSENKWVFRSSGH
ncbi:MAG: peroxide stress protein YaaA, partial [Zoogloeaceae bacterium]|nr:peroxide stress protein YaaA [Zoogloeaceae bacterium]